MIDLENQEREIINIMLSQRISWLAAVRIRRNGLAQTSKAKWQKFMVVHQSC